MLRVPTGFLLEYNIGFRGEGLTPFYVIAILESSYRKQVSPLYQSLTESKTAD